MESFLDPEDIVYQKNVALQKGKIAKKHKITKIQPEEDFSDPDPDFQLKANSAKRVSNGKSKAIQKIYIQLNLTFPSARKKQKSVQRFVYRN